MAANQIELNNEEVEGIVTVRLERDDVNGDTPREVLQI